MSEPAPHHHLVQAPVRALDADGRLIVGTGTIGFAAASVVLGSQAADLDAAGRLWWWWVALTGTALGAVAWLVLTLRRRR